MAVALRGPFMVMNVGLAGPVRSPDQSAKLYPGFALARIETSEPLLCQFVSAGLTDPPAGGFAEVVKLYWVAKLAVYIAAEEDTVIVRICEPPSFQFE